ncbi:cellulase (glycosyl hydrolase family 5) [Arcicella aurantiaca]|uniref:Cellulase (Glycosyl hydrolase family 5) n=1 Tax=Arcicella aurantiaca TaxID=591202 RepID=A0A316DYP9_9BACT|nr:cellulase family glycosylhydrolase [Arcicella aurantiaca]PWK22369.1 cellulase (glycosyl hydrolase family 5) [Arcicella aurantiaca]
MKNIWVKLSVISLVLLNCSKDSIQQPTPPIIEPPKTEVIDPLNIAGLNWADGRDNFVDGWLIPSGLTAGDNYGTVMTKTEAILNGFSIEVKGVNTIRIPINPPSVADSWWNAYQGVLDKATSKGFNVIVACWEGASSKDGLIDDTSKFWTMWDAVVAKYQDNPKVYFEPFNEPHGYSLSQLTTIYQQFLDRYPNLTRGRIILDGQGYAENVVGVGGDSRFKSCLLGLHNYAFWATRTLSDWKTDWRSRFGNYANRTVITEFGAAMSTGKDYQNGNQNDNEIAYIMATSDICRNDKISSVYWPGLRDGDSYSLLSRSGTETNISISTVNTSGVYRIRYGWGL